MANFYVVEDGFLVSHGYAQDGTERLQAKPGQVVVIGNVPENSQNNMQFSDAKLHIYSDK